jgi:putative FmdB family regulatory protein
MPLYDYQCSKCQHVVEVRHGFNDSYTQSCPACGGQFKRIISPAPVIFKGSGFYVTDSRKPSGESSSTSTSTSTSTKPETSPSSTPSSSKESAA